MKISCDLQDFVKALERIISVVPKVPLPPSLALVKIAANSDGLVLLNVANLRVGVQLCLRASVLEAGVSCTPVRELLNCLSHFTGTVATVTLLDDLFHFQIIVEQQEPICLVPCRAEDCIRFPSMDDAEPVGSFVVQDVREALSLIVLAAAYEYNYSVDQAFSCVWMQCEESGSVTFA